MSTLAVEGILGMNRRNLHYIQKYNPRSRFGLIDDKLKTKELAMQAGVAVPELIGTLEHQYEVNELAKILAPHSAFVMKPTRGSGGKGVMVITRAENGRYWRGSGQEVSLAELQRHASNILAGLYTLTGRPDSVLIEGLVIGDPRLMQYSYAGVPDVRIIVFKGYPVMSMLRLSTAASDGKANLHQGAVGVGIDLESGRAKHAVQWDQPVERHPDLDVELKKIEIPQWSTLLELSSRCFELSGLGYIGVDIVLDESRGPLLLELNARPGLAIQIANRAGLLPLLRRIESDAPPHASVAERLAFI